MATKNKIRKIKALYACNENSSAFQKYNIEYKAFCIKMPLTDLVLRFGQQNKS